ncbi:acyltransferase family protein [Nocardioides sp. TF02-7]|uniref:acyltransferase family protein n=1 Tax=Nocardioides sp. TF02-7 TaxID=2917724 RepID=UPI001F0646FE|nr:acyltransferase family protein [Nocardioides sp. TF02-7]UMG93178.1 acyltransferase family protein [Nocardioides sp. TF02-7]
MASSKVARDPWLDNAKMALVTLVVIGHAWTMLPVDELSARLYDFLYAWHMPAFVLVTGYLSRAFTYAPERMWQLVRTVAVPYVLFECLMALFRIHVGGEELEDLFKDPHWPLWYLTALLCWRLMTPLFRPLPAVLAVTAAVVLSVTAGTLSGDGFELLDLSRVLGLLPFFVLGTVLTKERLELLRAPGARWIALAVLVLVWQLAGHFHEELSAEWLYYSAQYDELGASDLRGAATRLFLLGIGAVASLAFLALVPRRGGWFARMGAATLVVYLFHGFFVRGAEYAGYAEWAAARPDVAVAVTVVGSVAIALALAAPPVARRLQVVVDPFGAAQRRVDEAVGLTAAAQETGSLPPMQSTQPTEAASR